MTGKTPPQHQAGQLQWHNIDYAIANQRGPRRSAACYRAKMFVTGHPPSQCGISFEMSFACWLSWEFASRLEYLPPQLSH
jgi:hypothetical protein